MKSPFMKSPFPLRRSLSSAAVGLASVVGSGCGAQAARPAAEPSTPAKAPRPNVLLILADDLGWSDLGCFGGEIRTPKSTPWRAAA